MRNFFGKLVVLACFFGVICASLDANPIEVLKLMHCVGSMLMQDLMSEKGIVFACIVAPSLALLQLIEWRRRAV